MRIKLKDLELALEHIKLNTSSEYVEFDIHPEGNACLGAGFIDKNNKHSTILLYDSLNNITPEVKTISKLYKK